MLSLQHAVRVRTGSLAACRKQLLPSRSGCAFCSITSRPANILQVTPSNRRTCTSAAEESTALTTTVASTAVAPIPPTPEAPTAAEGSSVGDIKAALLDSIFGTERGLSASSEVRAEINELISQLETRNPTPSPAEATEKLNGDWKLVYTSNSELLAVLALSKLPFVGVGDITQSVDAVGMSVENKVQLSVPLTRTSFSTTASFEVRSPKRLQLKIEKGKIQTPQLLTEIDIPSSLTVMGQVIDLSQLKSVLEPVNSQLKNLLQTVGSVISQQPDVQFPIQLDRAQTWLLTTYLDDDTRITRGDGGSVFILVKEISITPNTLPSTP